MIRCTVDLARPVAFTTSVNRECSSTASSTINVLSMAEGELMSLILPLLSGQPAAVDRENVAVDVVGRRGSEEHRRADDVLRPPPATGRDALPDGGLAGGVRAQFGGV